MLRQLRAVAIYKDFIHFPERSWQTAFGLVDFRRGMRYTVTP
jgi:hypothetical protein